jgi:hypothetical protein
MQKAHREDHRGDTPSPLDLRIVRRHAMGAIAKEFNLYFK